MALARDQLKTMQKIAGKTRAYVVRHVVWTACRMDGMSCVEYGALSVTLGVAIDMGLVSVCRDGIRERSRVWAA